jgi:hypothetical protein
MTWRPLVPPRPRSFSALSLAGLLKGSPLSSPRPGGETREARQAERAQLSRILQSWGLASTRSSLQLYWHADPVLTAVGSMGEGAHLAQVARNTRPRRKRLGWFCASRW